MNIETMLLKAKNMGFSDKICIRLDYLSNLERGWRGPGSKKLDKESLDTFIIFLAYVS